MSHQVSALNYYANPLGLFIFIFIQIDKFTTQHFLHGVTFFFIQAINSQPPQPPNKNELTNDSTTTFT